MTALVVFALMVGAGQVPARTIQGVVPRALAAPTRVLWVDADEPGHDVTCELRPPGAWLCAGIPADAVGIVVVLGEGALSYIPVGAADAAAHGVMAWGRVLRLLPGGVTPDAVHDVRVSAWQLERSSIRKNARRFPVGKDLSIQIVRLSPTSFWLAGNPTDPDAFLLVEGPTVASARLPIAVLGDGPPDMPFFFSLGAPDTLSGRVESASGSDVADATVELWQPVEFSDPQPTAKDDDPAYLLRATATTDSNGGFAFRRLESGRYRVEVRHPSLGRGAALVTSLAEPVVVRLTAPGLATGRVWRHGAPVPGARVRFVPDPDVFRFGTDPTALFTSDVATDADGRFVLPLPPRRAGMLQFIAGDGAVTRVTIPPAGDGDVEVGDVTIPDRRRVMVRLLDPVACTLFATGPLGPPGMAVLTATGVAGTYWFDLPEPGTWLLSAECDRRGFSLEPPSIALRPDGPDPVVAVRLVRP